MTQQELEQMTPEELQALSQQLMEQWGLQDAGVAYQPAKMVAAVDGDRIVVKVMGAKDAPPIAKLDSLTGQIIAAVMPRNLWLAKESPRPACSSDNSRYGRLDPEQIAFLPYKIPDGQDCKTCPYDQWEQAVDSIGNPIFDVTGRPKMTKRCKIRRALLMLSADFNEPIIVSVSTKSVKRWDTYADGFVKKRKHFAGVLTRLDAEEVRDGRDSYGVMVFTAVRDLDPIAIIQADDARPQYMPLLAAPQVALLAASIEGSEEGNGKLPNEEDVDWADPNAPAKQPF